MKFPIEFRLKILRLLFQDSQFKKNFLKYLDIDYFEAEYARTIIGSLHKLKDKGFFSYETFLVKLAATKQGEKDIEMLDKYTDIMKISDPVPDSEAVYETIHEFITRNAVKETLASIYDETSNVDDMDMTVIPGKLKKALNTIPTKQYNTYNYYDEADNREKQYKEKASAYDLLFPLYNLAPEKHCIQDNEFVVIGAAPTRGKSGVMLNMLNMAQLNGLKCVYITFEIRISKIAQRLDAIYSKTNIIDINGKPKSVINKVKQSKKNFGGDIVIQEFPSKSMTVDDIEEYLTYLKETEKFMPNVVFLDYIDLLKPDSTISKSAKTHEKLADIYAKAVGLQQKMGITFITASQTNKTTTDKVIVAMEDLSDSPLQKMASVDKVMLFCQTPLLFSQKKFIIHTDKDRNGPGRGTLFLYKHDWDKQIMRLEKQLNRDDIEAFEKAEKANKKKTDKRR